MKLIPPRKEDVWGKIGLRPETKWERELLVELTKQHRIDDHGCVIIILKGNRTCEVCGEEMPNLPKNAYTAICEDCRKKGYHAVPNIDKREVRE